MPGCFLEQYHCEFVISHNCFSSSPSSPCPYYRILLPTCPLPLPLPPPPFLAFLAFLFVSGFCVLLPLNILHFSSLSFPLKFTEFRLLSSHQLSDSLECKPKSPASFASTHQPHVYITNQSLLKNTKPERQQTISRICSASTRRRAREAGPKTRNPRMVCWRF